MRIAIVTKNLAAGGAERVIAQLLKVWSAQNIDCELICIGPQERFYTIPENVKVYEIPEFSASHAWNKVRKYVHLRGVIKKRKPDVVLSLPEEIGIYAALSLLGTGIPVVVSERNDPRSMPYKKVSRALRRMIYPFVKGLIFQTPQAAAFFPAAQQKKGIVLPNPLDLSRLPEVYWGEREKRVVAAGRLEPQKNFDLLIDAFAAFYDSHQAYQLTIYGEGSLRSQLEAHIARMGLLEGTISLPGRTDALLDTIRTAEMFVMSSDFEGMPNVLIEAMACGVPSISTACPSGGPEQIIVHGENGLLIPVGDRDAMVAAMDKLAREPELAQKFSSQYSRIRQQFDAEQVCGQWLNYLKEVCRK